MTHDDLNPQSTPPTTDAPREAGRPAAAKKTLFGYSPLGAAQLAGSTSAARVVDQSPVVSLPRPVMLGAPTHQEVRAPRSEQESDLEGEPRGISQAAPSVPPPTRVRRERVGITLALCAAATALIGFAWFQSTRRGRSEGERALAVAGTVPVPAAVPVAPPIAVAESVRVSAPAHVAAAAPVAAPAPPSVPSPAIPSSCSLDVRSNPQGAGVFIDGVPLGVTPLLARNLACGRPMRVMVASERFQTWARTVTLNSEEILSVRAGLERQRALLSITSEPQGAEAWIDGRFVGLTPTDVDAPALVPVQVSFTMPGHLRERRVVHARPGRGNAVHATLSAVR